MPLPNLPQFKVAYSAPVTLPNGKKTLGLFNKYNELFELRACVYDEKTGKFHCPRQSTHPNEREMLQRKLGIKAINKMLQKKMMSNVYK